VGNIDRETLHRYIERYIAPIPRHRENRRVNATVQDRNIRFNQTTANKHVYQGQDKTLVNLLFANDYTHSFEENMRVNATTTVLTLMLIENIREKISGVYSIYSRAMIDAVPVPQVAIQISFGCDPNRIEELTEAIIEQVNLLINNEFEERFLTTYRETIVRTLATSMRTNNYWLTRIDSMLFFEDGPNELLNHRNFVESITREDIANTARKYIDFDKKLTIILYPENLREASD